MTTIKPFLILLKQFLFWMLFFAVQRAIFLLYYFNEMLQEGISFSDFLLSFFYAIKLDVSTTSYMLAIPFFLILLEQIWPLKVFGKINKYYNLILIFLILLTSIGEMGLYKEWNAKLSFKALVYLQNPAEVIASAKTSDIVIYTILLILDFLLFRYLYNKFVYSANINIQNKRILSTLLFLVFTPMILIIGARGGVGQIPITVSQSYFSKHDILNLAAVNPLYNIVFSTIDYYTIENAEQFRFMPDEVANSIVKDLHRVEHDTTIRIINIERPNIVIIFLESWAGDLIESLGGLPGLTPQFHELEKEGILFTNFFASGNRSQQALASVFSGFPAIPITTLTDHPQKYGAVESMIKTLKAEGYYSSFYFGGDLNYGNIKSYLVYNEFDKLVEENDFSSDVIKGKLGVHDQGLFEKMNDELGRQPRPFFTAALTLSSHSPYDQPGERPISNVDFAGEYVNSAWYSDKCLGEYMRKAKQSDWYDSTLFIIMSDHSHLSYNNYQWWSFDYRRIPLLIMGGALREEYYGLKKDHIGSNTDITSTLLKQLNLPDTAYFWSKNLFNPYAPEFAFFELNDGFGWKTKKGKLEYNVVVPVVLSSDLTEDQLEQLKIEGEAYIQVLFREFLLY